MNRIGVFHFMHGENEYDYFSQLFIIDDKRYYSIWCQYDGSDESKKDKVMLEDNKVLTFTEKSDLIRYAERVGITIIEDEEFRNDIHVMKRFRYRRRKKDCIYLINIWNMVSDINYSLGRKTFAECRNSDVDNIYDKMFYGLNLPAITPEGEEWLPTFTNREEKLINELYKCFLRTLRKYFC